MDQFLYGYSKEKMISLTFVDVTDTAKLLERKHLSGPTAGRFLGESLVAVSMLSSNLGDEHEKVSLQMKVNGPIGGCFVEASKDGSLRGYTSQKILNDFDGVKATPMKEIFGESGSITIIRSDKSRVLAQDTLSCNPPNIKHGVARYFNEIQKKPTGIEIISTSLNHYLHRATGIMITRLPEGKSEDFVPMLEKFNDKTIAKSFEQLMDINQVSKLIGMTDLQIIESRPLKFRCTCSHEKVVYSVSCLPIDELKDLLESGESPEVTCHFCNETYRVSKTELTQIIRKKANNK